ncbi:orotidine 5'-phosphate decarboxylase [Helicobacter sp. 13S00401-1]|uniref:orotidine-5'-phosphate decarboxylase n=1 Tax=Helicobacter sp. 13S00401-1 TaxID=1905758 RepID=UPI000BA739AB|nr:orotidine-5'-phosphate decarboxylase [Helicobacter sp. 13S00401-1]PAF50059.1 orotidine 5'-phosphate decarboxylase [Helicobacter sp. 13S00401-1]
MRTKLCVALDLPTKEENLALAKSLKPLEGITLKVGLRSFIRDGKDFVKALKDLGFSIFLDLKLYDIPNTMNDALKECIKLDIDFLSVHASSGKVALNLLTNTIKEQKSKLSLVSISILTSFDERGCFEIYNKDIKQSVSTLALLTKECDVPAIVCSPHEIELVKERASGLFIITPGIRLQNSSETKDDQKRVLTPLNAKRLGSDMIVVGRPIYKAKHPIEVASQILKDLSL